MSILYGPRATVRGHRLPHVGVSWIKPDDEKSERYLAAVRFGGAEAVPLLTGAGDWSAELARIDGLVLTGGGDVDPGSYGEANAGSRDVDRSRDERETQALQFCRARGIPILAICRGFQLANVVLGGRLIQDLRPAAICHPTVGGQSSYHEVDIRPGPRLAVLLGGKSRLRVNSRHHQGIDLPRLAPGVVLSAIADDGIVEGFELPGDPFFVAVQCHPEYLDKVPDLSGIFALLASECEKRWRKR